MAQLAIKGHAKRGIEVIELLEMLGGINEDEHKGFMTSVYYFINDNYIDWCHECTPESEFICFSLEEFLEKFPYKVGDEVQHKGATSCGSVFVVEKLLWEDNQVKYIVNRLWYNNDKVKVASKELQPYKEETMEDKSNLLQQLKEYFENTPREIVEKEWHEYDKYNEISPKVNEYLEYINNIRKPQYPKTYEECLPILDLGDFDIDITYVTREEYNLHTSFIKLKRCRDAYWKIAGEQMGLGKPWEPDWENSEEGRCCIVNIEGDINLPEKMLTKWILKVTNKILVFPTEEMRDAFYENFKELIEQCKELL